MVIVAVLALPRRSMPEASIPIISSSGLIIPMDGLTIILNVMPTTVTISRDGIKYTVRKKFCDLRMNLASRTLAISSDSPIWKMTDITVNIRLFLIAT